MLFALHDLLPVRAIQTLRCDTAILCALLADRLLAHQGAEFQKLGGLRYRGYVEQTDRQYQITPEDLWFSLVHRFLVYALTQSKVGVFHAAA